MLEKMELIDPVYIEEADQNPVKRKQVWIKWTAMAACFCLICGLAWLWKDELPKLHILRQDEINTVDTTQEAIDWIELATEPYQIPSNNGSINGDQSILDGKPMILQALQASCSLKENRVVVTRHEDVAKLCRDHGVKVVLHDLPHRSDTVRLGLEALGDLDCCMFLPGDQPLLRKETVAELIQCWESNRERIIRPECGDIPGSPVLFPRWDFPDLMNLPEGKGGNCVIKNYPDRVTTMNISDSYELMDADTPETLKLLLQLSK